MCDLWLNLCGVYSCRTFSTDSAIPRPPFNFCHRTATKSTERLDRCVHWEPAGTSHNPQGHYQLTAHNEWLVVYVVSAASLSPWNRPTCKARRFVLHVKFWVVMVGFQANNGGTFFEMCLPLRVLNVLNLVARKFNCVVSRAGRHSDLDSGSPIKFGSILITS